MQVWVFVIFIYNWLFLFPDVDVEKPDEKSIMTYVAQFLQAYPEIGEDPAVRICYQI